LSKFLKLLLSMNELYMYKSMPRNKLRSHDVFERWHAYASIQLSQVASQDFSGTKKECDSWIDVM
jgi:hypothetical protein